MARADGAAVRSASSIARCVARHEVRPVAPKIRRVWGTSPGLQVTLHLPAGLAAVPEQLSHAWGVHTVHVCPTKPGFAELRMTGYDLLRRVQMTMK